ncbi:MAG: hypothetical protein KKA65_00875 [Nanoarchaeota archaeon]|nr:hypothetical protein [Nanoarchaeota archaeon]MBU4242246.1 hypothetical protein [Nanoarchaeota archaeon]MBU4352275.1 hypothetical protein [Nanoarchaeota archaeon]MBU4456031.1 hypothetical protein [Nanoarchaeota archaeon]MCG2719541.1 hypothetical protein [Nanoarchaeota archaeon]
MVFGNTDMGVMLRDLENLGFYEVLLPFLLIFTIIFAILQKIKLFGPTAKNINIIVAVIIAFFVVRVPSIVGVMTQFLPKVSILVLVLLMFLLVLGIFGAQGEKMTGGWLFIAMLAALVGLVWAIFSSIPSISLPSWLELQSGDLQVIGLIIALFGGIYLITRESGEKSGDAGGGNWKKLADSFGAGNLGRNPGKD